MASSSSPPISVPTTCAQASRSSGCSSPAGPSSPPTPIPTATRPYRDDEYGGLLTFPFASVELCLLAVHPSLVGWPALCSRTDDVRIYSAEAWAKYTGAARYEQAHHRDFLNHTVVVPSDDPAHRNLELFVFLHEVDEDLGPTHVVSTSRTEHLPLLPHGGAIDRIPTSTSRDVSRRTCRDRPGLPRRDGAPRHRADRRRAAPATRCTAASARRPTSGWAGRVGATAPSTLRGSRSSTGPSVEQLALFGFPPPGHRFWTPHTLDALEVRYPGLDTAPWRAAATQCREHVSPRLEPVTMLTCLRPRRSPNLTVPSAVAKSVSSPPRPTLVAGVDLGAALAHQDGAGGHRRAVEPLHAEALRVRVAAVAGGPASLGLGHLVLLGFLADPDGYFAVMAVISSVA